MPLSLPLYMVSLSRKSKTGTEKEPEKRGTGETEK
jgi:hypothetical protein